MRRDDETILSHETDLPEAWKRKKAEKARPKTTSRTDIPKRFPNRKTQLWELLLLLLGQSPRREERLFSDWRGLGRECTVSGVRVLFDTS